MWSYLIGFVVCFLLLGVFEKLGVPNKLVGYLFVVLPVAGYAMIGISSRPSHLSDYYVAGRNVPALYNGMATAADWMSAASFVGLAGTLFLLGYDGLVWLLGWTAGFVVLAVLIVPYLRKSGAVTVPEFLATRYESQPIRLLSIVVVMAASFAYLVAQIYGCGIIASRFLGLQFELAVYASLTTILLCCVVGGMRAVTWTQTTQCVVMIVAYLAPLVIVSSIRYGFPIPFFVYGFAIDEITLREQELLRAGLATVSNLKSYTAPFQHYDFGNFFAIAVCMMLGTTVMPHVITRYVTTPTVREARTSVVWTLFFVLLIYCAVPAYAAFSKLEVYSNIVGRDLTAIRPWVFTWGELGLIRICGKSAINLDAVVAACKSIAGHPGVVRLQDLAINTDVVVLSTPEISGLPYFMSGLLAAGAIAAALSTANGLLITVSTALSHDLYYKTVNPMAPPRRRLAASRVVIVLMAVLAAWVASRKPGDVLAMVGWGFSLAASGLFPALVLGIWWRSTNKNGAVVGMLTGFLVCLAYPLVTRYFPGFGVRYLGMTSLLNPITGGHIVDVARAMAAPNAMESWVAAWHPLANKVGWFGINNISAAIFGVPAGLIAMIVASSLTKRPPASVLAFVDSIREPEKVMLLDEMGEDRARL